MKNLREKIIATINDEKSYISRKKINYRYASILVNQSNWKKFKKFFFNLL